MSPRRLRLRRRCGPWFRRWVRRCVPLPERMRRCRRGAVGSLRIREGRLQRRSTLLRRLIRGAKSVHGMRFCSSSHKPARFVQRSCGASGCRLRSAANCPISRYRHCHRRIRKAPTPLRPRMRKLRATWIACLSAFSCCRAPGGTRSGRATRGGDDGLSITPAAAGPAGSRPAHRGAASRRAADAGQPHRQENAGDQIYDLWPWFTETGRTLLCRHHNGHASHSQFASNRG